MYLQDLTVSFIPPFMDEVDFDFNEQVNLFIGPNACGKSTILRIIDYVHSRNQGDTIDHVPSPYPEYRPSVLDLDREEPYCKLTRSSDWPLGGGERAWGIVPLVYIPATRVNLPPAFPVKLPDDEPLPGVTDSPWDYLSYTSRKGIFYGHLVDWTIELIPGEIAGNRLAQNQLARAVQLGYSCSKRICSEVIAGDSPHPLVEVYSHDDGRDERSVHNGMGIVTSDDVVGEPLFAGALSSGTQGTLMWVWALAFQMAHHYSWTAGWQQKARHPAD